MTEGLLIVNTGDGKGKTTAALGQVFRALGHGFKICVIQFIKGSWKYGELESAKKFDDQLEIHVKGRGFTWKSDDIDKDIKIAREAWEFAKTVIESNKYQMIVLDELTYLITYGMVEEADVLNALRNRPEGLHVVVTGRGASKLLIEEADLVTEMKEIKHPFRSGTKAQRGIEF
ncbi:MAG: cob(I)yrinic acid a,c-diamide adenosyltransferase [Syntrophaceae bacterium]|nr:cob(I)yrinic acid a,c-diamide adenosyltransferase [Syntrophaceae bacterium]